MKIDETRSDIEIIDTVAGQRALAAALARSQPLRITKKAIFLLLFLPPLFLYLLSLADRSLIDIDPNALAGYLLGFLVALFHGAIVLMINVLAYRRRRGQSPSKFASLDEGGLHVRRGDITYIVKVPTAYQSVMLQDAFIIAFITPSFAHVFPRAELEQSDDGRRIVQWLLPSELESTS